MDNGYRLGSTTGGFVAAADLAQNVHNLFLPSILLQSEHSVNKIVYVNWVTCGDFAAFARLDGYTGFSESAKFSTNEITGTRECLHLCLIGGAIRLGDFRVASFAAVVWYRRLSGMRCESNRWRIADFWP